MKVRRFLDEPIITANMDIRIGVNINGPSPMVVPDWIEKPLGRFYLYFADHRGLYIRLAYADAVEGPWRIHEPGCFDVAESLFVTGDLGTPEEAARDYTYAHVASPDVHAIAEQRQLRLYYHGLLPDGSQMTRVAVSEDGLRFHALPDVLGPPYFRAFAYGDCWYALALPDQVLCSDTGLAGFHPVGALGDGNIRHTAVLPRGDVLHVFFSRIGDAPEHLLHGVVDLKPPLDQWRLTEATSVLTPEHGWEGADLPVGPSIAGEAPGPVRQLRDPGLLDHEGRVFLFYAAAGESGIGAVELIGVD